MAAETVESLLRHLSIAAVALPEEDDVPWYARAAVAVTAWLAGLAILAVVFVLLGVTIGLDDPETAVIVIGLCLYAGATEALVRQSGAFVRQFLVPFAAAGYALVTIGLLILSESAAVTAVAAAWMAIYGLARCGEPLFQVLVALGAAGWVTAGIHDLGGTGVVDDLDSGPPYPWDVAAIAALGTGLALLLRPIPGRPVAAAGATLAVAPAFAFLALGMPTVFDAPGSFLLARIGAVAMTLALLWPDLALAGRVRPAAPLAAILVTAAAALTTAGIALSAVLLVAARRLASPGLAFAGIVAVAGHVVRFYYDLEATLLVKSIVLTLSGLIFLAAWVMLRRWEQSA